MPKVIHYRNKCIGCGVCYEMMPSSWRMSRKDGKATLVKAVVKKGIGVLEIGAESEEPMEAVAKACPVRIIRVQ
jgi:ferredoxin